MNTALAMQSAGLPEGRPTLAAVARGDGHDPRVNLKVSMGLPSHATQVLTLEGDDLTQLLALDRQYTAMWREWGSIAEHEPAFLVAKKNYDAAEHQLAEAVHQILQRDARPSLVLADECDCGHTKRADRQYCLECSDVYGLVAHDDDERDALPLESL